MDINDVSENGKLQSLFKELNISNGKKEQLCVAFQEHVETSKSKDMFLHNIKRSLDELAKSETDDNSFTKAIKEISNYIDQHGIVFDRTVKRLAKVEQEISIIKEKHNVNESLIITNEIATLYVEYIIKPILFKELGNISWSEFCKKLSLMEKEADENRMQALSDGKEINEEELYKLISNYVAPIQKKIAVDLNEIRELVDERNALVHFSIDDDNQQQQLLEKAKKHYFPAQFPYKDIVHEMILSLNEVK